MLFSRAFLDDGHLSLQTLWAAITAPKNLRALGNSLLLAMLVGVAGTLLGLIFAFTVERVGARAPCVAPDRLLHLPAADFAAVHHLDRLRVFVRTARPDHLRTARDQERPGLWPHQHVCGGNADLFSDRLSGAAADAGLDQHRPGGGRLQPRRLALARVPDRDAAAGDSGAGQCLPAAVRMLAGGFRNAADSGRQRFFGAADRGLSADHRDVRPQERRDPVAAAAGAGRTGVLRAGAPCRRPLLCHRHRQGRGLGAARLGIGALPAWRCWDSACWSRR